MNDLLADLNDRQREAVRFPSGPLLILAGAGSGKTRVITHRLAHLIRERIATPREIVAVTFTNKAAGEMKERVAHLLGGLEAGAWVGTFHALCLRILRRDGAMLGYSPGFVVYDTADQLALVRACLKELGMDGAAETARSMLHRISSAKNLLQTVEQVAQQASSPAGELFGRIYRAYQEGLKKNSAVDFDDLLFQTLLLFESFPGVAERYASASRFLLVDEYQDTNHAQFELVKSLGRRHRNICVVGDEDQCLTAGTLVTMADGSRKSIEQVRKGDLVLSCYGSGDLRPAPVSEVFRKKRRGEAVLLLTEKGHRLVSTPEHTHFAGYRLGIARQRYLTYLMFKEGIGYRLGTSCVYTKGFVKPVVGTFLRARQEHADALWVLSTHSSENEARAEETILSLRYQIPTLPFVPRKGRSRNGLVHDASYIKTVFGSFDTAPTAARLLADHCLSLDHPHHLPRSRDSRRRNVVVTLCGDRRGARSLHRISIIGNDLKGRQRLESLGFSVRPARSDSRSWRFETASKSFGTLLQTVDRIREGFDIRLILNARLGKNDGALESNSLPFLPASGLRPGMALFDANAGYDSVESVEWVHLEEDVFDLNVEGTHNFVANGIVTHNSIFSWRGADISNILDFKAHYPDATIIKLEQNYRSTRTILSAADAVIAHNSSRIGKTLWTDNPTGEPLELTIAQDDRAEAEQVLRLVRSMTSRGRRLEEIAVLYRTNYQSRLFEEVFLRERIPHQVVGSVRFYERKEIKDVVAYLRVLMNADDDLSLGRILNIPPRGIGKGTLDALFEIARAEEVSLNRATELAVERRELPARADNALRDFMTLLDELRSAAAGSALIPASSGAPATPRSGVTALLATITNRIGYTAHLEKVYPGDYEARLQNLDALVSAAAEYDEEGATEGLQGFVDRSSLRSDTDDVQGGGGVTLLTAHSVKGLEFPVVIVTGLEENIFPHIRSSDSQAELEEERRLFYVAMTRARERLFLTAAASRRSFGDFVENPPSRFLEEIPSELVREKVAVPAGYLSGAGYNPWRDRAGAGRTGRPGPGRGQRVARGAESIHYDPGEDEDGYAVGMKVTHPMFGKGTIAAVEGSGPSLKLTIRFAGAGTRKILPRHTTLTVGR